MVAAVHAELGQRWLCVEGEVPLLFTENETNNRRLFGTTNAGAYVKDGINDYVVLGRKDAVNPAGILLLLSPNSPPAREPDVSIPGEMWGDFRSPRRSNVW